METAPLVATLTTLLALGLSATLVRLARQERQRSDARVSMLVSLAAEPAAVTLPAQAPPIPAPMAAPMPPPVRLKPRAPRAEPRQVAQDIEIFRDVTYAPSAAAPELFEPAPPRTGTSLGYVFAGAVIMAALFAFAFRWAVSAPGATTETTQTIAAPALQPLSLVSLSHVQHPDGTLVISGVVRNPPDSAPRERLFAVASLIDSAGVLIASARAPLDFTTLAPGDESPFVVRVAGATGVARYRVGFRDAGGESVAHVDKR